MVLMSVGETLHPTMAGTFPAGQRGRDARHGQVPRRPEPGLPLKPETWKQTSKNGNSLFSKTKRISGFCSRNKTQTPKLTNTRPLSASNTDSCLSRAGFVPGTADITSGMYQETVRLVHSRVGEMQAMVTMPRSLSPISHSAVERGG